MKKKIVFLLDTEYILDSRAQKEINTLLKMGHEVLFCGWNKNESKKNEKTFIKIDDKNLIIENICIKVKKGMGIKENILNLILYEIKVLKFLLLKRKEYDYIHACNMDTAFAGVILKIFYKKKLIYDIYDDYADAHNCNNILYKFIKIIDKRIIKLANAVIICSEQRINQLAYIPSKLYIIHNSPPNIIDNKVRVKENDKIKIAYFGNLIRGRLIEELLEIVIKSTNLELYCGGDGELVDIFEEASKKYENIKFFGRVSYEEVLNFEKQCDIIPALYDPKFKNHSYAAPNKFYESLMLGKLLIMVKETGISELVSKYGLGVLIDFNKQSLKKGIEEVVDLKNKNKIQEEKLKNIYKKFFSWKIMEQRIKKIYEEL